MQILPFPSPYKSESAEQIEWEVIHGVLQKQDSLNKYLWFKVTYCGLIMHLEAEDSSMWP